MFVDGATISFQATDADHIIPGSGYEADSMMAETNQVACHFVCRLAIVAINGADMLVAECGPNHYGRHVRLAESSCYHFVRIG
jgi:hypothetical protein